MLINTDIVSHYLESDNLKTCQNHSFMKYVAKKAIGLDEIPRLSYSKEDKKNILEMTKVITNQIESFYPNNLELWQDLFPKWKEIASKVTVHLVVGLPKNYDALALQDENGGSIIVYDVGNWLIYKDLDLRKVIGNLLTHELAHLCIYQNHPKLLEISTMNYREKLNAISFDEGWAHLLSFENREISSVDWNDVKFRSCLEDSIETMIEALGENRPRKQEEFIFAANTGEYYQKFGAMMGMIYLGQQWMESGNLGLKNIFHQGYEGFIPKILKAKARNY